MEVDAGKEILSAEELCMLLLFLCDVSPFDSPFGAQQVFESANVAFHLNFSPFEETSQITFNVTFR